jgi:putative Mn2+ efflux pump MntP
MDQGDPRGNSRFRVILPDSVDFFGGLVIIYLGFWALTHPVKATKFLVRRPS